jgi:hypothetical protein
MESKNMMLLIENLLKTRLLVMSFFALAVLISTTATMMTLRGFRIGAEQILESAKLRRDPIDRGTRRRVICVDSNVILLLKV